VNGAYGFDPVGPGSYTVCEVLQAGWVQTFPNAGTADPAGESIASDCVPPNGTAYGYGFTAQSGTDLSGNDFGNFPPQPNTLTIVKQANPQGPATFDFTASGGLTPASFVLDDDGNNANAHSNTQVFQNVGAGSYVITETPTSGFTLGAIDCTGATNVVDLPNDQVSITAVAGEAIVCTFTNNADPHITIVKDSVPNGTTAFSFAASGGLTPASFVLDDDGDNGNAHSNSQTLSGMQFGQTYTITETPTSGFSLSALNCTGGQTTTDLANHQVAITVAAGDNVVCTFTNTQVQVSGITTSASAQSALAFTGTGARSRALGAFGAIVAGAMFLVVARRRRKGAEV
jgi:hypothetical protein